jgi:hypothetical protein
MFINKISIIILAGVCLFGGQAHSHSHSCQTAPIEAIRGLDKFIKSLATEAERSGSGRYEVPNLLPLGSGLEFQSDLQTEASSRRVHYEALLRPRGDQVFELFHLILFKLERARHVLYVCLNQNSEKPDETYMSIYFLKAYGLQSSEKGDRDWVHRPGDWLFGPEGLLRWGEQPVVQLARIPVEVMPLHRLTNGTTDLTEGIPFVEEAFKVPGTALKFTGSLLSSLNEKLGAGIERITLTPTKIEFANDVDPEHPERATVIYEQKLNPAEDVF